MIDAVNRHPLYYFSNSAQGGLAEYSERQIAALLDSGCRVRVLGQLKDGSPLVERLGSAFRAFPATLSDKPYKEQLNGSIRSRFIRKVQKIRRWRWLAGELRDAGASHLMLGSFEEYWSPFWAGPLKKLREKGLKISIMLHDPVRDFVIGPSFFHNLCLRKAFSLVDVAFVHDPFVAEQRLPYQNFPSVIIPHGVYHFPNGDLTRDQILLEWGLDRSPRYLLSFGHIRDGKNLHLVLEMLQHFPKYHLIVAGREQSSAQKPIHYYQALANRLGVSDRCHWFHDYIPEKDVWRYFRVSDVLVLTYNRDFNSASGVLNAGVHFRIPMLVSSGSDFLRTVIDQYALGQWVVPDASRAIQEGLIRLQESNIDPKWDQYETDFSWSENARMVTEQFLQSF